MTTQEFKKRYPEYAHLEGDALWDKMTEMFPTLQGVVSFTADPDRDIVFHPPVILLNGVKIYAEDESQTVWIDEKGNKVKFIAGCNPYKEEGAESYRFDIIDLGKNGQ